jgi:hypothetical protein
MGAPYGNKNAAGPHRRRRTYIGRGGRILKSTTYKGQMRMISRYTNLMEKKYGRGWP